MSIQSRRASTPYLYCLNKHTLTDWNILNCVNLQNSFPKSSFLWSAVCMLLIPALSELHHYLAKVSTYIDEVADVQMHCSCCHRGSKPVCVFPIIHFTCALVYVHTNAQILFTWMTTPGRNKIRSKGKWKWIKEPIHLTFSNNFACGKKENQTKETVKAIH